MAENGHSDLNELHDALHRIAPDKCPSCGANDWLDTANMPAMVPTVETNGTFKGTGIEAIVAICARCGFIRMHAAQILRRFI